MPELTKQKDITQALTILDPHSYHFVTMFKLISNHFSDSEILKFYPPGRGRVYVFFALS